MNIKISFTPYNGMVSNYQDCRATAPDGSVWQSKDNQWMILTHSNNSISYWSESERKQTNKERFFYGSFAFFITMAFMSPIIGGILPNISIGLPVLLFVCSCSAVFVSRIAK